MTTTFYICAAVGWIVTLIAAYALGWVNGYRNGDIDGLEEAMAECRRRCAHD